MRTIQFYFLITRHFHISNYSQFMALEYFFNVWLDIQRICLWAVEGVDVSFPVYKEFGEVPWYFRWNLLFSIIELTVASEIIVDWMGVRSIAFNFLEDRELSTVLASCKIVNFLGSSWLLLFKLVAREGQDLKTGSFEFCVYLNQLFVVLVGQSSLSSDINEEICLCLLHVVFDQRSRCCSPVVKQKMAGNFYRRTEFWFG